jgi:hypothetical protein
VKLLKKDGKFVKKGGKFVKTDDPAACPCCGGDPPPCECFPPPTISSLTVAVRTLAGETEPSLCVEVVGDWSPPDGCYVDSDDSRSKADIALKFFNDEGEEVASIGGPATLGELLGGYCTPLKVACDPANESQKVASAVAVVTDKSGLCPPATSEKKDMADGAYESACPPPPPPCTDADCCIYEEVIGVVAEAVSPGWTVTPFGGGGSTLFRKPGRCDGPDTELFTWREVGNPANEQTYPAFLMPGGFCCGGQCQLTQCDPCTGFGRYIWTGTRWELDTTTCSPSADCRPAPPPTQPGSFVDELVQVDCKPIARSAPNPLP